ncbi:hypothetical protein Tco_0624375 [Tanacetum coccineum]|uniref:Reverse transcriptase domain-containing protein n=1 Tax=Tanacetum coccineum TaxID=301880 RepID=A0ABQ4WDU3_9ASTR
MKVAHLTHVSEMEKKIETLARITSILKEYMYGRMAIRTDNQEKNEKQSQNNKTGLGMEKTVKDKAKSKPESITTRSGVTIQGPKAVNHNVEVTRDTMPPANNGSTEDVQPPVVQIQSRNPNPEPNVAPVVTPVPKASIPFPSRRNDEKAKGKKLTIKSEIFMTSLEI